MERLRIVLIYELGPADDGSFLGGIESHILGLATQLAKHHDVTLLTGMLPGARRTTEMNGFRIVRSEFMRLVSRSWDQTTLTTARQLACLAPSLVRGLGLRADIYHGHLYTSGFLALALSRLAKASAVSTIHGSYYDHWLEITNSRFKARTYRTAERLLSTFLANESNIQIHTASDFAKKVSEWGGDPGRMRVILNGVDTERFQPIHVDGESKPIVMTIRRLVPKNGVQFLVEAARYLQTDAELWIIGGGPQMKYLKALASRLPNRDAVRFLGPIPNSSLPRTMARASVIVVPSIVEASSISLLEAMAMEKPTIVTDIPGIDEVASPERSVMVPPRDPPAIARAIDLVLSSPTVARRMGKRARRYVVGHRSHQVMSLQTLRAYRDALAG